LRAAEDATREVIEIKVLAAEHRAAAARARVAIAQRGHALAALPLVDVSQAALRRRAAPAVPAAHVASAACAVNAWHGQRPAGL
jgi:hypothetical protein